jgi:hypothetical protein
MNSRLAYFARQSATKTQFFAAAKWGRNRYARSDPFRMLRLERRSQRMSRRGSFIIMIGRQEIDTMAERMGVHRSNVQHDYVSGWLLAVVYGGSPL